MQPDVTARRQFLKTAGLGVLAFTVNGAQVLLTPAQAREQHVPLRVLTAQEVRVIEALGEGLLPGAREAGLAQFLDHQLAATAADSLLMLRYLDVPPPYLDFYRASIAAVGRYSRERFDKAPQMLDAEQMEQLIAGMAQANPPNWQGPPAPLFYFVLRSDAVDVVYGTPEGFEKLGIPYMAHIMPPTKW